MHDASLSEAVDHYDQGAVVVAVTPDGSAAAVLAALPPDLAPPARAVAAPASRGTPACLVRELGVEGLDQAVVVVEQAHWADATSLGRLQRWIGSSRPPFLLILTHPPGEENWGISRLLQAARGHVQVYEIGVEGSPAFPPPPADEAARDLVLAATLTAESLPVRVAARLLDTDEGEALRLAESLVESGHLRQTRRGFSAAVPTGALGAGEARVGHVAARLAAVLEAEGGEAAVVGSLLLVAGDAAPAYPYLTAAARHAAGRSAAGEAHHLAVSALGAAEAAGAGPAERGELHLIAGRYLRAAGRSEEAGRHLDRAVQVLQGPARIDALGFSAAVADDRQRPQEAERILAAAEWEAARQGESAKLGSLSSFRARAVNRLGFPFEADALMAKARAILQSGASPVQLLNAENNQAWVSFDRGLMREAEVHFTHVRDQTDPSDTAGRADKEAWRARVLLAAGRLNDGLAAVEEARRLAAAAEVEAPLFLVDLALAQVNAGFGRTEDALAAADRVLDLVERQLPAWKNVAHASRAAVLVRTGRGDEALEEVERAKLATPPGADGWRWRCRIEAIELEAKATAGHVWDRRRAEDLVDLLLQARFYGWAAELMCALAEIGAGREVAEEAMALALRCGTPMLAARAAAAGKLWKDPGAAGCIRAVRAMEEQVPASWADDWRSAPGVRQALDAPDPTGEATGESTAILERALRRSGLADESALSPAQRRSRGMVPRRTRGRWSPLRVAAAVVGVAAVAAATSWGVAQMGREGVTAVTIVREVAAAEEPPTETSAAPTLEETQIAVPESVGTIDGSAPFRGGPARTGVFDVSGPARIDGYYWSYDTAGPIIATPVAYGRNLLVPSTDGTLYAIDQTDGSLAWTLETGGRLSASPEVATVEAAEGQRPALAIVAGDDGVVRARDAVTELASERWSLTLDSRIASSPVTVGDLVVVATVDGAVHGIDMVLGEEVWRHPVEGSGLGTVSAPLAAHDGVVYVGTEEGNLHLLEAETGQERCSFFASADIVASPLVSGEALFLPTRGNTIFIRPAGACQGSVPGLLPLYGTETPVEVPPAVEGETMYLPSGQFLYAIDLADNSHAWSPSTVDAGDVISAAPVVADGVVYFGTRTGLVRAVDGESGETLWEWQMDNFVRASPVVVDGAVFVAGGDGRVYALGSS